VEGERAPESSTRADLIRLAQFGANIVEAYSCFILLPAGLCRTLRLNEAPSTPLPQGGGEMLELVAHHSLSNHVLSGARLAVGSGMVGWVAKHHRAIHVSPFERDSRLLGMYSDDEHLKCFLGVPIELAGVPREGEACGVLTCDSRKSFAFTKIQGKLLQELASEVGNLIRLWHQLIGSGNQHSSWGSFVARAVQLAEALGPSSVEALRLVPENLSEIEKKLGCEETSALYEQVVRLVQQALPPHFPLFRTPTGDLCFMLDAMMTSFFANKIDAICERVQVRGARLHFRSVRRAFHGRQFSAQTVAELVRGTIDGSVSQQQVAV